MRFPGIIPAVTTPFDATGAVDVAALEAQPRCAARRRRPRLRRHRHDGRGRLDERRGAPARGRDGRARRRRARAGDRRRVVGHAVRVDRLRGRRRGGRRRRDHAAAAARLPRRPARDRRVLPRGGGRVRAADHGLQQPRGERDRPAGRADRAARRRGRRGRRDQGVLGRRAPDRGPEVRGAGPRGAGRRRRLGARGLLRRRDRLGHRASATARRPSASSSTTPAAPASWTGRARCTRGCSRSRGST